MHRTLFLIILMGQCNSSTCQPRVYHFVDQKMNWSDAQSYCREKHTDLATINDTADMKLLSDSVDSVDNEPAWIGLQKSGERQWYWPIDNTTLKESEAHWGDKEPNNANGNENCVVVNQQSGKMVDVCCDCDTKYYFICQHANGTFKLIQEGMNWINSLKHCVGRLASPKTNETYSEMIKLIKRDRPIIDRPIIIGLTVRYPWKWSDGSNASFKHWQTTFKDISGQKRLCAVTNLTDEGKWNAKTCSEKLPFFCYSVRGCLDGWQKFNGSCYRHFANKQNWSSAEQHCQDLNAHLGSINSRGEQNFVISKFGSGDQWIGLKDKENQSKWTDGSSLAFTNWDIEREQPGNDNSENCVMIKQGKWHDVSCNSDLPFICKNGPDNLFLIKKNMTWFDAVDYCRENHHELVSVHNALEQKWVRQRAKMADTAHVWLGMHYSCALEFWYWLSDQDSCYRNWAPGSGTGACGMATAVERGGNQSWVSLHHDGKFNFICVTK